VTRAVDALCREYAESHPQQPMSAIR
jgi:hypothetical protein